MADDDSDHMEDLFVLALTTLARSGIAPDVQELLSRGNPDRNVPPGALARAIRAVVEADRAAHGRIVLTPEQWDKFVAVLDAPPKNNPALTELMQRKAPWDED